MRTLRNNKETLLSILETFVHDPLVEWKSRSKAVQSARSASTDPAHEHGRKVLKNIESKLEGGLGLTYRFNQANQIHGSGSVVANAVVAAASGHTNLGVHHLAAALTVEGQVREVIEQATDLELLSRMWIGWSAYL
jgi:serine/threonine-protein kinase ATR